MGDGMIKLWELYYWNKHRYEWVWIAAIEAKDKVRAIQTARLSFPACDVLKVEEYK